MAICNLVGTMLTSIISMSTYNFIACLVLDLEKHTSPLQTCNYDQSLVVMDTNTPSKFYCFVFELWVLDVKNNNNIFWPIIAP